MKKTLMKILALTLALLFVLALMLVPLSEAKPPTEAAPYAALTVAYVVTNCLPIMLAVAFCMALVVVASRWMRGRAPSVSERLDFRLCPENLGNVNSFNGGSRVSAIGSDPAQNDSCQRPFYNRTCKSNGMSAIAAAANRVKYLMMGHRPRDRNIRFRSMGHYREAAYGGH